MQRHNTCDRRTLLRGGGLLIASVLTGQAVTACGSGSANRGADSDKGLLAQMKSQGYARLSVANQHPYSMVEPDGTVTGIEPDICKAVLSKMGITSFKGVVAPFSAMIPGLLARRFDLITAALFVTPDRCKQIIYSEPDVVTTYSLAVPAGNPKKLTSVADCSAKKIRLGLTSGDYGASVAKKMFPDMEVQEFTEALDGVQALVNKRIDAYLVLTNEKKDVTSSSNGKVVTTPPIPDIDPQAAAVGFRRENSDFRDQYNEHLAQLKKSGEIDEIYKKYNISTESLNSTDVTTAELCKA